MKRVVDVTVAALGLIVLSPLIAALALAIYQQDYNKTFYIPPRVARGGGPFRRV